MTLYKKGSINKLSDVTSVTLRKICNKRGFQEVRIITSWYDLISSMFSGVVLPIKISKMTKRGVCVGTLHLQVKDGPTAMEVSYAHKSIIDTINNFYGSKVIDNVKVVQIGIDGCNVCTHTTSSIGIAHKVPLLQLEDLSCSHRKSMTGILDDIKNVVDQNLKDCLQKLVAEFYTVNTV